MWRRLVGKNLIRETRGEAQGLFLGMHRFGTAIPGGTDVLVHFRGVLEELLQENSDLVLAVLDLDLQNAFPSFEWDSIQAAVKKFMPKLLGWTRWVQKEPATAHLPSGEKLAVDRGAEQGDPLGSLYCGLVVAMVMEHTRKRLDEECPGLAKFSDAWYMDDGQLFCKPEAVDDILRVLDEELAKVGATRGCGSNVKSVARLVGQADAVRTHGDGWLTARVRDSCKLPGANSTVHVLGVDIGDDRARNEQFQNTASVVSAGRHKIGLIGDAATELVLTRRCGDVCKVTHLLRAHGCKLQEEALNGFDSDLDTALALAAGGPLHQEALLQARLGARQAGLGVRAAADVVLPAFVASRLQARPLVLHLAEQLAGHGLLPNCFDDRYNAELNNAKDKLAATLTATRGERLVALLHTAAEDAQARAEALAAGRPLPRPSLASANTRDGSEALIVPAGGEDPEWGPSLGGLQQELDGLLPGAAPEA